MYEFVHHDRGNKQETVPLSYIISVSGIKRTRSIKGLRFKKKEKDTVKSSFTLCLRL